MCSLGYCLYDLLLLFHILVFNPLRPSLMANAMFSPSGRLLMFVIWVCLLPYTYLRAV